MLVHRMQQYKRFRAIPSSKFLDGSGIGTVSVITVKRDMPHQIRLRHLRRNKRFQAPASNWKTRFPSNLHPTHKHRHLQHYRAVTSITRHSSSRQTDSNGIVSVRMERRATSLSTKARVCSTNRTESSCRRRLRLHFARMPETLTRPLKRFLLAQASPSLE